MKNRIALVVMMSIPLTLARCRDEAPQDAAKTSGVSAQQAPITNRVDIPDTVRRNLGITFAKVEMRPVAETIRVPGRFEYLADARREYRTMLAGRVELLVKQFQRVERGALLYQLDSPPWRELQQKLAETQAEIGEGEKRVEMIQPMRGAHERHHKAVEETVTLLTTRLERLEKGQTEGSISAEEMSQVQTSLAQARAQLAEVMEKETELAVQAAASTSQLGAARVRFELLLNNAATLLDLDTSKLLSPSSGPNSLPLWRTREHVEVFAGAPGFVDTIALTNGAWASETSLVLTTVQPEMIRFHAHAMQSDIGRFQTGLPARIVPPRSNTVELHETMEGQLEVGLSGDPEQRTVDLYLTPSQLARWARPGVTGHLEIVVGGGSPELAIPVSAAIQDGLSSVLFRRDPANPDKVIRIADADLGVSDGRWVAIKSGVKEGDEVVLNGLYQLMVATSGSIQKGGHFHADGTFHEGDE